VEQSNNPEQEEFTIEGWYKKRPEFSGNYVLKWLESGTFPTDSSQLKNILNGKRFRSFDPFDTILPDLLSALASIKDARDEQAVYAQNVFNAVQETISKMTCFRVWPELVKLGVTLEGNLFGSISSLSGGPRIDAWTQVLSRISEYSEADQKKIVKLAVTTSTADKIPRIASIVVTYLDRITNSALTDDQYVGVFKSAAEESPSYLSQVLLSLKNQLRPCFPLDYVFDKLRPTKQDGLLSTVVLTFIQNSGSEHLNQHLIEVAEVNPRSDN